MVQFSRFIKIFVLVFVIFSIIIASTESKNAVSLKYSNILVNFVTFSVILDAKSKVFQTGTVQFVFQ